MSYKKVKLSEICTIEKGATGITKAIEGEYPMVTMAEARTSHNEYQFDPKAVLIPLVSSSGHGHASMKRIHYQEGKFAVGSILCALVPKNEEIVNARFLYNYLHFQRESILVPLMRGAANVSLSIKSISSVEINLPPIEIQTSVNKLVDDFKLRQDIFQTELKTQSNLLSKLRQAYLQEAVMGKLTEPSQDDAKTLLADIKSQKAQLIKEGKLRKEKPLPPIKPEEIPFAIPDNWVWCRLGEITNIFRGSSPRPKGDNRYFSTNPTDYNWITISDITNFSKDYILHRTREFLTEAGTKMGTFVDKNEFIIAVSGSTTGKCCLTGISGYVYDGLGVVRVFDHSLINEYLLIYMLQFYGHINGSKEGSSFPNINTDFLKQLLIPIPPISEQKAIVEKVEGLLANVSLLEEENKIQQNEVQRLMGAVLQEAFGGGK
jgi:type I restriction enzyme S subunit